MTDKVFKIGLGKTGSRSLHLAMRILGFRSLHNHNKEEEIVLAAINDGDHGELDDYDCFMDGSHWKYYRGLLRRFPNARYIFTTRDKDAWMRSVLTHLLFNRYRNNRLWWHIDTQEWEERYERLHNEIPESFRHANYLELDICAGDGWEKLCPFLGVDVPNAPFPHANVGLSRLQDVLRMAAAR